VVGNEVGGGGGSQSWKALARDQIRQGGGGGSELSCARKAAAEARNDREMVEGGGGREASPAHGRTGVSTCAREDGASTCT